MRENVQSAIDYSASFTSLMELILALMRSKRQSEGKAIPQVVCDSFVRGSASLKLL